MILEVSNLNKTYPNGVMALRGVSFNLNKGETLAVVGESGCGKSTLAKALMKIEEPELGEITYAKESIKDLSIKKLSHKIQMIFQDPHSSLNPRKKLIDLIREPLMIQGMLSRQQVDDKIRKILNLIGFNEESLKKYPHMFSGGQKQRICIARALVVDPEILICDEPVSALDLSIQAQVLNLLKDIQSDKNLSYIFISHDLSVVKFISQRIMVMYLGEVVEIGSTKEIFENPQHPYTQLLLQSIPQIGQKPTNVQLKSDELPLNTVELKGCGFYSRCPYSRDKCKNEKPQFENNVRCYYPLRNHDSKN
ncbi:MAG: ATP-binding cassette domain-containing protein [Bdellovibrionales bacterium]|nr:ATP-binding cassette domain-containing protein [Bdellovibrionales bacterium]